MKILVTGGTGFVGKKLITTILKKGYQVTALCRSIEKARKILGDQVEIIRWDSEEELNDVKFLETIDGVIHLAGENVFDKRWNEEQKEKLFNSRILVTRKIISAANKVWLKNNQEKFFLSASAIGFYGDRDDEVLTEKSPLGQGFLSELSLSWEEEVQSLHDSIRKIWLRIGVVLGKNGGALEKMTPIFKLGLGGKLGSGKHWMSFIHIDDLISLIIFIIENKNVSGVINGTSPHPVTNLEFTKTLGKVLHRPTFFSVPAFMIKVILGEVSTIVLSSQRVLPERALEMGFQFKYPKLETSLKDILIS